MHPIIAFYLDKQTCDEGFSFEQLVDISDFMIGNSYFYIAWLFPSDKPSKWNHKAGLLTGASLACFKSNQQIQQRFLQAVDMMFNYFDLVRNGNECYYRPKNNKPYWLRNIGHESKKISRLIYSIWLCGYPELARNLQQLALKVGAEKGHILSDTLSIWQNIIPANTESKQSK